jgi:DNA (cytosine-5)-methyltransferase 1
MAAGFCAGASPSAGNIGYQEETAPTLKAAESGTNQVPSVLCINDQGGSRMDILEDATGALRAQTKGHPPLVYSNHGADARYNQLQETSTTISAHAGSGGNNLPLVAEDEETYCIAGNAIDREPHNSGNGLGWQTGISYTLTGTDRHSVYSRQRLDEFKDNDVACTQSARQHKDATDLMVEPYQETVDALIDNQYAAEDEYVVEKRLLIRRLTPLECELLQGYPPHFTDIPGASDSARYKALGNSVAIPCVDFIMRGIAYYLGKDEKDDVHLPG